MRPVRLLLVFVACFLFDGATPGANASDQSALAFMVEASTTRGRLRASGRPGDLGIRHAAATAIVRKSDGMLVDFWPNPPRAPSIGQLGNLLDIDGLWLLSPHLTGGFGALAPRPERVEHDGDAIVSVSQHEIDGVKLRATTRYRLEPNAARLVIETKLEHLSGARRTRLGVSDTIRWGNVDYVVGGVGRITTLSYFGSTRWIGRHGASGDLILRTQQKDPMQVSFGTLQPGIVGELRVDYGRQTLEHGGRIRFTRTLAYEPLEAMPSKLPPRGTLEVTTVDEHGLPLPAKLSLRSLGGASDPDFGNDGGTSGAGRFLWSGDGRFCRALAVGRYAVLATAGIERDAAEVHLQIAADQTQRIELKLPRVIDSPGWISADLHLHQAPSPDADVDLETRLISVAAEGVDLAVASDHYSVTNFAPALDRLLKSGRLTRPIATLVGTEVTTIGNRFGHFNVFPLEPGRNVRYADTTPRQLFAEMRKVSPNGIIQVNHPRWPGAGYFTSYGLETKTGKVPRMHRDRYASDFDALEVYNGLDLWSFHRLWRNFQDWLHLLGQGHRYTATGNSDSHKLAYSDPGVPRNMIHYGRADSDAADLQATSAQIVEAIRGGRVVVTTGPILEIKIGDVEPGGTVSPVPAKLPLRIRVRAAGWIDVTEVQVLMGARGSQVRLIPIPPSKRVVRFDETVMIPGRTDTFVIVFVRGRRPLPNVYTAGVTPLAFSNPIWLGSTIAK